VEGARVILKRTDFGVVFK